jgi:hypothetical protein
MALRFAMSIYGFALCLLCTSGTSIAFYAADGLKDQVSQVLDARDDDDDRSVEEAKSDDDRDRDADHDKVDDRDQDGHDDRSGRNDEDDRDDVDDDGPDADDRDDDDKDDSADERDDEDRDDNDSSGSGSGHDDKDDDDEKDQDNDSSGRGSGDSSGGGVDDDDDDRDKSNSGSSGSGSGSGGDHDDPDPKYTGLPNPGGSASATERGSQRSTTLNHDEREKDRYANERRAGEVLVLGDASTIDRLRATGHVIIACKQLRSLDATLIRVRVPRSENFELGIESIRRAAPNAVIDANYLYHEPVGETPAFKAGHIQPVKRRRGVRLGIIDTGANLASPALRQRVIAHRSFTKDGYRGRPHGTMVAAIAASAGGQVYSADVFGLGADQKPIASADAIVQALDWMARIGLPVVNVSVAGPPSAILATAIERTTAKGMIVVAAAGNSGRAGGPAYPAAYPNVIAITAVDKDGHIYERANRGDYISFAALGVGVPVCCGAHGPMQVTGTSFAAPRAAAMMAARWAETPRISSAALVANFRRDAEDLGPRGWDATFGWGRIDVQSQITFSANQLGPAPTYAGQFAPVIGSSLQRGKAQ